LEVNVAKIKESFEPLTYNFASFGEPVTVQNVTAMTEDRQMRVGPDNLMAAVASRHTRSIAAFGF